MENNNENQKEVIFLAGIKPLSAEELLEYRNVNIESTKPAQKKTHSTGSPEEKDELEKLLVNLKKQISNPRVERLSNRIVADWDAENKRIKVTKIVGKFQNFGYTENKTLYLTKYETLFLLELNRLELYFNSVLVSVEQAYYLLFGEHKSKDYENYLVYSTLSRAGYIVKNFDNNRLMDVTEENCIWEILFSFIKPNYEIPSYIRNYEKFDSIKNSMNAIKEIIKNPTNYQHSINDSNNPEEFINFDRKITSKRKATENNYDHGQCKKIRYEKIHKSFLNELMNEPEYEKYREIFMKLELILMNKDTDDSIDTNQIQNIRDLNIVFDIYIPSENSIKYSLPDLQAIIIGPSECFPSNDELNKVYNKQKHKIPLIVISVGVSKQIQAFMYYFT